MKRSFLLLILVVVVFLQSCSSVFLANKTEYLQGKIIYELIQPKEGQTLYSKSDYLVEKTNSLDSCKQYLLAVYVLSEGFKYGSTSGTVGFYNSFVTNLIDNLELYTSVFRGEYGHHLGVYYYSKRDVKKDLRDWKRILKCN